MAGPWEEYQGTPAAHGPWDDYAAPEEKPGILQRALSNLGSSAKNAVTHPSFPGMPVAGADVAPGENFSDTVKKNVNDTLQGFKDLWHHPVDTVVNYVKEKFATDPVGTALAVAAMGKPALEEVPAVQRGATAVKEAVRAGGKDIAIGGAKVAAGAALAKAGPLGEVGDVIAGVPIVKSGAMQAARGFHKGYTALKQSLADSKAAEAGPPMAGAVPMSPPEAAAPGAPAQPEPAPVPSKPEISLPDAKSEVFGPLTKAETPHPEGAYPINPAERTEPAATGLVAKPDAYVKAAQTVKGRALARYLRLGQIPLEDAQSMTPEQWKMAADGAGVNLPSPESVKVAISELGKLYDTKGAIQIDKAIEEGNPAKAQFYIQKASVGPLQANPKAMKLAQQLAEEMAK